MAQLAASSQASSHFPLEPVSADVLAEIEIRRRSEARALGLVQSGCNEVDGYVLQGGLERGGVVGLSAEEEGFGLMLGLQMLVYSLCEGSAGRAMVVTPKPATWIAGGLRDAIRSETARREQEGTEERSEEGQGKSLEEKTRDCLDRVMLSQVFDVDGLLEVLAELDEPAQESESVGEAKTEDGNGECQESETETEAGNPVLEVKDSQDDCDSPISIAEPEPKTGHMSKTPSKHEQQEAASQKHPPAFILVTHVSTLLTSLFTQREKSAAHSLLQLLSSRLRYLSRSLPSQPLFMLLNSTTTISASEQNAHPQKRGREGEEGGGGSGRRTLDATLRSVFNPPELTGVQGYVSKAAAEYLRRNKPMFGLVFSQLLDVHLLCTRGEDDGTGAQHGDLTVVEVLLDEIGIWEGRTGRRRHREQRWGVVKVERGRIVDGFEEGKRTYENVRIVAGFGGPKV